jgi:hypothetical protein
MLTAQSLDIDRSDGDVAGRSCGFAFSPLFAQHLAAEMLNSERLGRIQMETVLSPERTPSQAVGVV